MSTQCKIQPLTKQDAPPIGNLDTTIGWQKICINETNEPLICINDLQNPHKIDVEASYYNMGYKTAKKILYSRYGLVENLKKASGFLPDGLSFKVFDAWRPLELQLEIFNNFLSSLQKEYPNLTKAELKERCKKYVSLPSSDPTKPSPHYSGGAIDLTLVDKNGNELWMGTGFDDFTKKAMTDYFEKDDNINSFKDKLARYNRRILFNSMIKAGFSNYPEEWWHYDFGNQFWGVITNKIAIYGPVSV